jgi:hypothetical protein
MNIDSYLACLPCPRPAMWATLLLNSFLILIILSSVFELPLGQARWLGYWRIPKDWRGPNYTVWTLGGHCAQWTRFPCHPQQLQSVLVSLALQLLMQARSNFHPTAYRWGGQCMRPNRPVSTAINFQTMFDSRRSDQLSISPQFITITNIHYSAETFIEGLCVWTVSDSRLPVCDWVRIYSHMTARQFFSLFTKKSTFQLSIFTVRMCLGTIAGRNYSIPARLN